MLLLSNLMWELRWRTQAFHALDAWVAASREWTVGGRSKRLMIHSVHGTSRPAAVLCAWMMAKGAGKVTLADALSTVHGAHPTAAPNFGFVAQLLEHGALNPHTRLNPICVAYGSRGSKLSLTVCRTYVGCSPNTEARGTLHLHLGVRWAV